MTHTTKAFQSARVKLLGGYIAYFAAFLVVALLFFAVGTLPAFLLTALLVALYCVCLRPLAKRYHNEVVAAILENTIGAQLADYTYTPGGGMSAEYLRGTALLEEQTQRAFRSWQFIAGHSGEVGVELADVSFAILKDAQYAMFSGCYIHLALPGLSTGGVLAQAGAITCPTPLPKWERTLLDQLCDRLPGLYLQGSEDGLTALVDCRFLDCKVNPLSVVTEATLQANPLPELELLLKLANRLRQDAQT